jgi:hypothetical protein
MEASKWTTWAGLFVVLVLIAPYEICFIFGINDRVGEIGKEMESGVRSEEEAKRELGELLGRWKVRNWGRAVTPVAVGVAGLVYGRK